MDSMLVRLVYADIVLVLLVNQHSHAILKELVWPCWCD